MTELYCHYCAISPKYGSVHVASLAGSEAQLASYFKEGPNSRFHPQKFAKAEADTEAQSHTLHSLTSSYHPKMLFRHTLRW